MRRTGIYPEKLTIMQTFIVLFQLLFSFSIIHAKTTYIIGVDGLSYEAMKTAQSHGLFKEIGSVSAHIASFPTMTDLVWADVFQTQEIFGKPGRLHSVEAVYFDESSKRVKGDVRDYYRRLAQPKYYMNGFEFLFNPYVEALMYFPTKEMSKLEVDSVIDSMLSVRGKNLVTGYIGAVDSTAHTQHERLFPVLRDVDQGIQKLIQNLNKRGEDFELYLISDHGNAGRFREGDKEVPLLPIDLEPVLEKNGLKIVDQLKNPNDVAIPRMALGTWAPVYVQETKSIDRVIESVVSQPWFDLAFQLIENSKQQIIIKISGSVGNAFIAYNHNTQNFAYQPVTGNPLQLPQETFSNSVKRTPLDIKRIEILSRQTQYPDSIIRLIDSVKKDHFDFPDLLLTFKDGYFVNNAFSGMTTMYRTHGSLSKRASLGIFAAHKAKLPGYVRSDQIFPAMGVRPEFTFGRSGEKAKLSRKQILETQTRNTLIETGARDYSEKKIFQMITKLVSLSRSFFVAYEIQDILKAFGINVTGLGNEQKMSLSQPQMSRFDFSKAIRPEEIGELTDIAIKNPDVNKLKEHPKVEEILSRILPGRQSTDKIDFEKQKDKTISGKRLAMKVYQIPYLLDQAFTFPEKVQLKDPRDKQFIRYWDQYQERIVNDIHLVNQINPAYNSKDRQVLPSTTAQRLFSETFKEAELEEKIAPQEITSYFNQLPNDATIVYVPGTYNGIFDEEIFSLGMLSIKEDLGIRTLTAPIKSACSADVNGKILLDFLKNDQKKYLSQKKSPPKYFLVGYSKGATDSLYALVQDKEFAKNSILGLVAVAAPLRGSPILGKADLPFIVVNMLIDEETPKICQTEKTATSTGSEQAMQRFWKLNERDLVGLTRYFSVSFVSDPEDSHLIMKITKLIAQFDEENDGIIPLSASKFPDSLSPIDLGTLKADHLAGILSSRFNQRAFMRSLVKTLGELKAHEKIVSDNWRAQSIAQVLKSEAKLSMLVNLDTKSKRIRQFNGKWFTTTPYNDPYDLNTKLLSQKRDPIYLYEPKVKLPANQISFDLDSALDVSKIPALLSERRVTPVTIQSSTRTIDLSFNHQDMRHYRIDHQWFYENRSPMGADNNPKWGFQPVKQKDGNLWLGMRSDNNSIRLTTLSYRFKPADFSQFDLDLLVTKGPQGADPVLGKSGKDDSSFQIWFTLRDLRNVKERALGDKNDKLVYTFGYYWGEEIPGENRKEGQIFENTYSNKNVVIAQLPPAFQLVLNSGKQNLGKPISYNRNFAEDIKRAYPKLDINQLEVIAITLQMDSNDTKTSSEAFFKTMRFSPSTASGLGRMSSKQ